MFDSGFINLVEGHYVKITGVEEDTAVIENEKNVFDKCFDLCKKFFYEDGIFVFCNVLKNKNFFEEKYYENKCNLKKEIKNIKESKQLNFY